MRITVKANKDIHKHDNVMTNRKSRKSNHITASRSFDVPDVCYDYTLWVDGDQYDHFEDACDARIAGRFVAENNEYESSVSEIYVTQDKWALDDLGNFVDLLDFEIIWMASDEYVDD